MFLFIQKCHIDHTAFSCCFLFKSSDQETPKAAIWRLCLYLLCLIELFQADVDEFCQYYGRRGAGLCFPDFQRRQLLGQDSNYLEDEKIDGLNRFVAA